MLHWLARPRDCVFCWVKGLPYDPTWRFVGLPRIRLRKRGSLSIGKAFTSISRSSGNSIGLNQAVLLRTLTPNAEIRIGDRVGVSGSTLAAKVRITVGDDVLIGAGTLITDCDAHPVSYQARLRDEAPAMAPIVIEDGVFIGTRSIVLKGVRIGRGSVVAAGSVVVHDVPSGVIVAGNPAKVVKVIE